MKNKYFLAIVLGFTLLTGCSDNSSFSQMENDYSENSHESSAPVSSSSTDEVETESNVSSFSSVPSNSDSSSEDSDVTEQSTILNLHYSYDMLNKTTLFNENGGIYFISSDGLYYSNINPKNIDYSNTISFLLDKDARHSCMAFDDCVYYASNRASFSILDTSSDPHLKRYDLNTSQISTVVGGEGYGMYCLDENKEIYGMIVSEEKYPVEDSDGVLSVETRHWCSLIKIQKSDNSYYIIKDFDSFYEYYLVGVYNNKAYLTKSEPDVCDGGTILERGKKYGLFEYDFATKTERLISEPHAEDSGDPNSNLFYMALYKGEIGFFYDFRASGTCELHSVNLDGIDSVLFTSKNDFSVGLNLSIYDDTIYIVLGGAIYSIENGESEYIGIPQEDYYINMIFTNPFNGKVSYLYRDANKILTL